MKNIDLYYTILKEELVVATGCTEPIALAYASATAKSILNEKPDKIVVTCSPNIIKNVKSVIIPNTNGCKGIEAAILIGCIAGDASKGLEVINDVCESDKEMVHTLLKCNMVQVLCDKDEPNLSIKIDMYQEKNHVHVELLHTHTNITCITKNGEVIKKQDCDVHNSNAVLCDRTCLNMKDILDFANNCELKQVEDLIKKQINYNLAIASEGIKNNYGAQVGKTLLTNVPGKYSRAIAYTAAASDARMSGCHMPVMTNSGSGNQGITTSLPVIITAQDLPVSDEKLYRALIFSNLTTVHLKSGIGRLSAYCGVVSAAIAGFAGIAYLYDENIDVIENLITNGLATASGMICDGTKESCASKIATALFSAMLGYEMAKEKEVFKDECGIVQGDVEKTIHVVGQLGSDGMKQTDDVILDIMTKKQKFNC